MKQIISILQIIVSVLLMITALLQQRGDGGLGGAFGSSSGGGQFYHKRRGFENILFRSTIVLACLFFILSVAVFLFD